MRIDPGPRDPSGYYIVLIPRKLYGRIRIRGEYTVMDNGDVLIVRVKSRSEAVRLLRIINDLSR